jgi:nitrite reductase (cytochrome c-552)
MTAWDMGRGISLHSNKRNIMNRRSYASRRGIGRAAYIITILAVAAATFGIMLLWQNVMERKQEAKQHVFRVVELTENTVDPAEWGKNYPRQYDSYQRTVDTERTKHGGSEAIPNELGGTVAAQKLDIFKSLRTAYAGYPFSVDFREARGHAYMLSDQDQTERVRQFKQFGACLHCHASVLPLYRQTGKEAGVGDDQPREQLMAGFEKICGMPLSEARQLVSHPVTCLDCHDPESLELRVTRPGFLNGIVALAESDEPVAPFASLAAWRKGDRKEPYDPNKHASRQELRSMVCTQCHVEYYFKGDQKVVTYPWHKGQKVEQIEAYYDEVGFHDWTHPVTGAAMLKAQHPEAEMWAQGIHARSGVSCADCHMPYKREGAIKVSDHQVRSPLLNVALACQTCHRSTEDELLARAETIQDRTRAIMTRAENALLDQITAIETASKNGANDDQLKEARSLHRKAQWRLDFVLSENSMGFHADQEAARILGEAIDYARQGELAAVRLGKPAAETESGGEGETKKEEEEKKEGQEKAER